MTLPQNEHYKYRTLGLTVLEKALDDICPKSVEGDLIKERVSFFNVQERLLDKEWAELEREALQEVKNLKKERLDVIKKIEKTRKTKKIEFKIKQLKRTKTNKIKAVRTKSAQEIAKLTSQLSLLQPHTKKYKQIQNKLDVYKKRVEERINAIEQKHLKTVENLQNSDNTKNVEQRLKQAHDIWDRKYKKLQQQFEEKEHIFNNRRIEEDQIRLSLESFISELPKVTHWCAVAGVPLKVCYQEVKERLQLLGRNSLEINELIDKF